MRNERECKILFFSLSIVIAICCMLTSKLLLDGKLLPRLIVLSIINILLIGFYLLKKTNKRLGIDVISLSYFLFVVYSILSIAWSTNWTLSIMEVSKIFLFFIFFLLIQKLLLDYKEYFLSVILKSVILIFFISCLYLSLQLLNLSDFSYLSIYKLSGISGHKNLYSSFIFLTTVCSLYSIVYFKNYWRYIAIVSIIMQLILIIFLRTRAVWFGYLVFISIIIALKFLLKIKINYRWIKYSTIIGCICFLLFFTIILPNLINYYSDKNIISENIEEITDLGTFSERVVVWEKTYDLIFDNFYLGVGASNWKIYVPKYSLPNSWRVQDLNVIFQRPHNEFLRILSEYGIIGFIVYSFFICALLTQLYRIRNNDNASYINILIAGIIGFLCISFFSFPLERVEHNIILAIIYGITVFNIKINGNHSLNNIFTLRKKFLLILMFISFFISFIFFIGFKSEYYHKKMLEERIRGNDRNVVALCDSAITAFTTVDNLSIPFNWYRGNANANLGNFNEAFKDFKSAYKYHPYNPHVLNDLGSAYYKMNNIDSAIVFYKEAIRINPRFDDPKLNLTAIFINKGNYIEAQKWNESIMHDSKRRSYYRQIINNNL